MVTLVKMLTSVPIVENLKWPPLKTQFFIKENKIQAIKVERNISYPEIYTPYTGAAGMLLHINGKFTMGKLKSSLLSYSFVLNRP